jgi:hypothetical protein
MFRTLPAHPQEAKQAALGTLRGCYVSWSSTPTLVAAN